MPTPNRTRPAGAIALWVGVVLTTLGALSLALLPTVWSLALAWLARGDPRRVGRGLVLAGALLALLGEARRRRAKSSRPRVPVLAPLALTACTAFLALAYGFLPYRLEPVRIPSAGAELGGTLVLPRGAGPHPAVVFVHGGLGPEFLQWGWQFYHLADPLARCGVASLLYDKRGYGRSGGERSDEPDFRVLAGDAGAGLRALAARGEIDPAGLGLLGFSAGGWVAPLAATQPEASFLIVVSGGGLPPSDEWVFDATVSLGDAGFTQEEIAGLMPGIAALRERVNAYYQSGEGRAGVVEALEQAQREPWAARTRGVGEPVLPRPDELFWPGERVTEAFLGNWSLDPLPLLEAFDGPMLFLFGGADRVVPATAMSERLRAELPAPGRDVEIHVFEGANHALTVPPVWWPRRAPGYLDTVRAWLEARLPGVSCRD